MYRISELTEFLGDQGRTGIHIYETWNNKTLPLVGPTVLSGQHLGPVFYYLIAPSFVLTGFNPVMPAVFTALLGVGAVGLLWWLARELFGWRIATIIAALWAVSPQIVASDRVLWEPNIIPFFIFLYLAALFKNWGMIAGIALGILVQLHYPNFLFIGLTLLFYVSQKKYKTLIGAVLGFFLILLPFVIYESAHGFEDITGVFRNFSSGGAALPKRQILANILDYSGRVMRRVSPIPAGWEAGALLVLAGSFFKPTVWKVFIGLWFAAGIAAMSLYRGVVFDHYLFFLLPAAFLLFGFLLSQINKKLSLLIVCILALFHLSKTDIFNPGVNDIVRIKSVSQEIIRQVGSKPFSFGLIGSRSFSDLHYRYFFLTSGITPEPILAETYDNLFLVCESNSCPEMNGRIKILCYDAHCSGEYPKIDLALWKIGAVTDIQGAKLYVLKR